MRVLKKIGLLCLLIFIGALNVFVYMNSHLYYEGMSQEEGKARIQSLERSNWFSPLNDLVFYELGKAYFDLGIENLGDREMALNYFQKSARNLRRSIDINPASPFAHFYLGQSLLHLNFFLPGEEANFLAEFRKAAELAGEDSELFTEVGKIFFSRWLRLGPEDREFTLALLHKVFARSSEDKMALFFPIWDMNVGDCSVMDKVLPRTPEAYRLFATFLGEKSLFLEERQRFLAEAERLEFGRARREVELGERALFNLKIKEARSYLGNALSRLRSIKFYQTLRAQNLIPNAEFNELKKGVLFDLIKCRVEERAGLIEVEPELREYLALEDQPREVANLEEYLRTKGILPAQFSQGFEDLGRLAVELLFQFKQNRYRDIIGVGRTLADSFLVIPEGKKKDYVSILQLIGDSYQKLDYLYDAGDIYKRAKEIDPGNIETLVRLRQNFDRLSDEARIREVDMAIEKIIAPKSLDLRARKVEKGEKYIQRLVFSGNRITLEIGFIEEKKNLAPLVSVFWNGRVVWEDRVQANLLSLDLDTKVGENTLEVLAVNSSISLARVGWRPTSMGERNRNFGRF